MASGKTIIPRSIKGFNTYIIQTNAYLTSGTPTNASRFNWTPVALTAWASFLAEWTPLFSQYSDRKGSYTSNIRTSLESIIANAVICARTNKLIELVKATVSLNADDCSTFNLPAKLAIPSISTHSAAKSKELDKTIIPSELVYPKLIPIGGGILQIKVYTESVRSGRAHKLKSFDEVEYAIAVFYSTSTGLPTDPSDARLTKDYSSKADFKLPTAALTANLTVIPAGQATPIKMAVLFFRWAKSKHPTLDGPWNGPFTTAIL